MSTGPANSAQHIFETAIAQQQELQRQAVLEMRQMSSDMLSRMGQMHTLHQTRLQVPAFNRIMQAAQQDPAWMTRITQEADEILARQNSPGTVQPAAPAAAASGAAPSGVPAG